MITNKKKVVHPDFALWMAQACEGNPDVPPPNYGRLRWLAEEIEKRAGKSVTNETVRKWFAGEVRPRAKLVTIIAQVLKVDEAWLSVGKAPELSEREMRIRNAAADGAVNLVAGLVRMDGGNPAFPREDDEFAKKHKVDLYAIIKGAQYSFHVVNVVDDTIAVPVEAADVLVVAVKRIGPTSFQLFEVKNLTETGTRKGGVLQVALDQAELAPINSFAERL